jgi:hypothetical protein
VFGVSCFVFGVWWGMTPGVTVSVSRFVFLWERLSASIVAAGKPLPQGECQFTWKGLSLVAMLDPGYSIQDGHSVFVCYRASSNQNRASNRKEERHVVRNVSQ